MLKKILITSALIITAATSASAMTPAFPEGRPMSQVVDKDSYLLNIVQQNRYIEAAVSAAVRPIRLYDIDGDGLDQGDLDNVTSAARAQVAAMRIQQWARYDLNGDGKITRKEVEIIERLQNSNSGRGSNGEGNRNGFERADVDGDGVITMDELRAVDGSELHGRMNSFGGTANIGGVMDLDKDKDGKVTVDEATEAVKATFARFDTNGDGFIDTKEMASAYNAVQNRRPIRNLPQPF